MGIERELFTDYLFNRKQQVSYLGELSPLESVTCGVPQCASGVYSGATHFSDKFQ